MHRAGVGILAGTDVRNAFCFPGFSLHEELALCVQTGLSPIAALQTATLNPAPALTG
jgi:imidazolonepropionase-like amidohydrolase